VTKKIRIDQLLFEKGLVESRSQAQRLVMAGQVRAGGQVVPKPSSKVSLDAHLEVDSGPQFVSRGGEKLVAAFEAFELDVSGLVCADVGASTGGFTDCLLQHGASRVYAIDVGQGILHWKLRKDPKVVVMEGVNARYLQNLPEQVNFITMDASFISVKVLLPVVKDWFLVGEKHENPVDRPTNGEMVVLIKPQFEAGRREVARGKGVIRNPETHQRILLEVLGAAANLGYEVKGLLKSPITGPKGNIEFLGWFELAVDQIQSESELEAIIEPVMVYREDG
jgi:23S rRNA (cytidine1920-2'-O)/16S rRNA (cytidine1409-2'-O)-methyltransferase